MVSFTGTYYSKKDDKGRIVFPAAFKSRIPAGADQRFIIKKSLYSDSLDMYTYEEWEKESDKLYGRLDMLNPEHKEFWREYMRDCVEVEPDPKFGRILIPRYLLDAIGIEKEVVFFGVNFGIEVWAKDKFENSRLSKTKFIAIAQSLSSK